ncbi:MAG: hypothetical protein A2342_05425 [Gallionellales bacterium RIFOXYB12_FULL_54_9]|nr:MAG: hypothetical protein A2342_05425 [Gallionellales bacterium RIFOXYB12_FULL_54_9]
MQKYLSEIDTIGEIRQSSKHPIGKTYVWVLVEGITDQKLYTKLFCRETTKVEIVHGGGIKSLRYAMQILVNESDRVIGIRDADFLHIGNQQEAIDRLFVTDTHDAEMLMLACDTVFQHLLCEHIPGESSQFKMLREKLLGSLAFVGGIRWLNHLEDLTLKLDDIGLADFYDAANMKLDKARCIQNVEARSPNKKSAIQEQEISNKISGITDYFNLCNGHDAVKGLALYISAKNSKGIKDVELERTLRIAYRKEDFAATKLYANLRRWQETSGCQL